MPDQILFILLLSYAAATLVQLLYWLGMFSALVFTERKVPQEKEDLTKDRNKKRNEPVKNISIVVCARNEEKKVRLNLPLLLNQNYRSFEILIIDDHSSDGTADAVMEFQDKYAYLRIVKNNNTKKSAGKKDALTVGLKAARFDIIAVTDADCAPGSENWLRKMSELLDDDKDIVLGYGPYLPEAGLLNKFVRFETAMTAIQYFSYALAGIPYMGVGRNMMYRKSCFEANDGFRSHEHIASGDDDLFIRDIANLKNVVISLDSDTFIYSASKPSLHSYLQQKMRHLSTGKHYKWYHQFLLGLYGASHAWHYFALIMLMLSKYFLLLTICLYFLRIFTVTFICTHVFKKLREQSILKSIVWLDAAMSIYYILAAPLAYITKTRTWK